MPSGDRNRSDGKRGASIVKGSPPASLSLTVLVDNNTLTDRYLIGEPGLSILLQADGKRILFDTGYSDTLIRNADSMGESLLDLDSVVLSHGHLDHTWGLVHLVRRLTEASINDLPHKVPQLTAHPYCFYPRPKAPLPDIGSLLSEERAGRHLPIRLSREPVWLTENLVFLGEIPRRFPFERAEPGKRRIVMPDGRMLSDELTDDSALAYRHPEGLVIITGCSHSGICNIAEYAREVCSERRILDIIGGFHLLEPSRERMEGTCSYLHDAAPRAVHACHCTSLEAKITLAGSCPVKETGAGLRLEY
jgi:7,8-dihydropterin-6-yl-methyl-4-(beta-D-ribofuranosyl)aminobenzene 5'-phosphate synthase